MSIREDWDRFKNPVKQAGHNIGSNLRDFSEEERQKEIERNRQTACEDFYGYTDAKQDKQFRFITAASPQLTIKTRYGKRVITVSKVCLRINEGDPNESLYVDFTDLYGCPVVSEQKSNPRKTSGIAWVVVCGILAFIFSKLFLWGCLWGVIKFIFAPPVVDLALSMKEEDSSDPPVTYILSAIKVSDCTRLLEYIDQGIVANIKFFNEEHNSEDYAADIQQLRTLLNSLREKYQ
ncbi:MAG: hypothetical protein K2O45_14565 [Oscillospiraceae bacterium]|nr:hypothetical protein [Oscillospiraceae bacterium]